MEENGIQEPKTLEQQLSELKKEQAEAERIYRGRMQLGALNNDPASVQELAQTILDRKMRIEDLESQIGNTIPDNNKYQENVQDNSQNQEEMSLTKYHKNPIVNWLQKVVARMERFSEKLDQKKIERKNGRVLEPKIAESKYDEYQNIVDTNFTVNPSNQKTKRELFIEKISGNGAYHTYGKNAQNIGRANQEMNLEKMQNGNIKMQENDIIR